MKFSPETLNNLKSLLNISRDLYLKPGNEIAIMDPSQTIVAILKIPETIPSGFGINDLAQFLSVINSMKEPELEFNENYMLIKSGRQTVRLIGIDETAFNHPNTEAEYQEALDEPTVSFELDEETIKSIVSLSKTLSLELIKFEKTDEFSGIKLVGKQASHMPSHEFTIEYPFTCDEQFSASFAIENFRFLPRNYTVFLCPETYVKFKADDVLYIIVRYTDDDEE